MWFGFIILTLTSIYTVALAAKRGDTVSTAVKTLANVIRAGMLHFEDMSMTSDIDMILSLILSDKSRARWLV